MTWLTEKIPTHTLSVKYLKKILTPKEYETLIKKYMKAKKEESVQKASATGREK